VRPGNPDPQNPLVAAALDGETRIDVARNRSRPIACVKPWGQTSRTRIAARLLNPRRQPGRESDHLIREGERASARDKGGKKHRLGPTALSQSPSQRGERPVILYPCSARNKRYHVELRPTGVTGHASSSKPTTIPITRGTAALQYSPLDAEARFLGWYRKRPDGLDKNLRRREPQTWRHSGRYRQRTSLWLTPGCQRRRTRR